jgi:hypothetical protein
MLLLKHLLFLLFETMQIIAHTPLGIFKGLKQPYDEEKYQDMLYLLSGIHKTLGFNMVTDSGKCYMSKAMIDQCIFFVIK